MPDLQRCPLVFEHAGEVYTESQGRTRSRLFADFKEHRGLRRCSGHGLARVRTALALEVLGHNLMVLYRCLRQKYNARKMESLTEEKAV
jgi:hypothetical protein